MVQHLTTADKVLMAASVCIIVASYVFANSFAAQGSLILVQVDGKTVYKTLLSQPQSFGVRGAHGNLTVEVRGDKVAITWADCPNHICVKTGWRSQADEVIVCVPNKVVVRIVGNAQKGVQATTG